MIYEFIIDRLKDSGIAEDLIFPVGAKVDKILKQDTGVHFAVYTIRSRDPEYDLEGENHRYREDVLVDFIARLYDRVHRMYDSAEKAFLGFDQDTGKGEWIHSVTCSSPEPDACDQELGLYRRTMLVRINWTPM